MTTSQKTVLCLVLFSLNTLFAFQATNRDRKLPHHGDSEVMDNVFNNTYSYRQSINENVEKITKAYDVYTSQIDSVTGIPKTKEQIGLPAMVSYEILDNTKITFANELYVNSQVGNAARQYLSCLTELKAVYSPMRRYYFYEQYSTDNYEKARVLHNDLMAAFRDFFTAQYEFKKEVISAAIGEGYIDKNHVTTMKALLPAIDYEEDEHQAMVEDAELCAEGEKMAFSSFKKGKYKLLSFGYALDVDPYDPYEIYKVKMQERYGITFSEMGCVVTEDFFCYNRKMKALIIEKFKRDIFKESEQMYDEIKEEQELKKIDADVIFDLRNIDEPPVFDQGRGGFDIFENETWTCDLSSQKEKYPSGYIIYFIVEKDGSVKQYRSAMIDPIPEECKIKIDKLLEQMPNWKPGKHRGRLVRTEMYTTI